VSQRFVISFSLVSHNFLISFLLFLSSFSPASHSFSKLFLIICTLLCTNSRKFLTRCSLVSEQFLASLSQVSHKFLTRSTRPAYRNRRAPNSRLLAGVFFASECVGRCCLSVCSGRIGGLYFSITSALNQLDFRSSKEVVVRTLFSTTVS
jgi:hypothetical protein